MLEAARSEASGPGALMLMMCDSGAGGGSWGHPRGVSGSPAEPQLERPESRALPEGEDFSVFLILK